MGNDVSKEINDIVDVLEVNNKSCLTPSNITRCAQIDPRSPSEGIMRTPIEVRKHLEQSEEMCLRRRWKSEPELTPLKMDHADNVVLCDPRSPTLGITRTPIQVPIGEKVSYDKTLHGNILQNVNAIVHVPDCRSPSLGICRTPIEVEAPDENETIKDTPVLQSAVDLKLDNKPHTNPSEQWLTPISKKVLSPSFVYIDEEIVNTKRKKDVKLYDQNSYHEKENEANLKRKLKFTPEPVKTGVKVRTPLGSRCNFQDSPSQFLKKIQVQKVDEEMGYVGENTSSNYDNSKSIKKAQPMVEWDNKDSTLIM
ncbi:hypothetical protein R5R35_008519 [Gryllus longicercus]|uniref:Uncharacterized protein n=1 Tax=Gryllus longicercus TaxID=2509291 RepID=A0AAN9VBU5_9ORTH